jgi:hypothetical protein
MNGKIERAFRGHMRDTSQQDDEWLLEPLRRDSPVYVHCRDYVQGNY